MSNSPLVSYTEISPHKNSPRNHEIDTITIHCFVGQVSVERMGKSFNGTDQKSCNYGVAYDGKIGMYVEEKDRSWCSSNRDNDHRAITIEVASDTKHPYAVKDAAYKALIDLLVDICKRNEIKELKWEGKKSLVGQVDKQNMSVHRWFTDKDCPGEYLYSRHGEIAKAVNARLGLSEETNDNIVTTIKMEKPNPREIWDFFISKGLNSYATAGIMGNLYAESSLYPYNLQNTYSKKFGMTDEEYTIAVDNGSYTNFVKDSAGYGLAQWTYWSRKEALLNYAKSIGSSIGDLKMQLEFMWKELQNYSGVIKALTNAKSIQEASDSFLTGYEKPADQSDEAKKRRASYGQTYYDNFAEEDEPFKVKVSIKTLNIRKGPGTNYAATGKFTGKGVFTIVEKSTGSGSNAGWGKLKSGAGWISLDYAKKI